MATPNLTSLKDFLDIDDPDHDVELPTYLDSATRTIGLRCGPLQPEDFTEQVRATCGSLLVSKWPVVSVTSVTDDDGQAVDVTGAKVNKSAGVIRLATPVTGVVEVAYKAGYDPCPDDLELAVYVVASHLWDTQRGRSGSFAQIHGLDDDAPVGGDASYFVMQGFALPRRAMELTRPYIKPGFR